MRRTSLIFSYCASLLLNASNAYIVKEKKRSINWKKYKFYVRVYGALKIVEIIRVKISMRSLRAVLKNAYIRRRRVRI